MGTLFLRNGSVFRNGRIRKEDILINDGIIVAFNDDARHRLSNEKEVKILDLDGLLVSHGFIDLHVHLREPGGESKETILTGTKAAARGGFTSVFAMPNTTPSFDSVEVIQDFFSRCAKDAAVKVHPIASLSMGRKGKQVVDYQALKELGINHFSDDGDPLSDEIIKEAMDLLKSTGGVLINHLEDKSITQGGMFADRIPAESEYLMLERDLKMVSETGCAYHAAHLSCIESVELIKKAKQKGLPVTAEVTPHHLVLTIDDIGFPKGNFQMKPPLRTKNDQVALINGLKTGVIDAIATDHAPHGEEKKKEFSSNSPFGITGLETAFPILYTKLVLSGKLTLVQLLESLTDKPAQIGRINGELKVGEPADLVVIDLKSERTVKEEDFLSKGKNSPFIGLTLTGWPLLTLVNGEVKYDEGVDTRIWSN
ncbi:MAG: dihydroorotase [Firmicutes bacterium]|nr:dihydroorotase [Bacillota bacterium]